MHTPHKLIATMALSVIGVLSFSIWLLYETNLQQQQQRLVELAQSRARLIEAIAHHEQENPEHHHTARILAQVSSAHRRFKGFGETGEFVLAKRSGDQMEFLLRHRHNGLDKPPAIPFSNAHAEPMRRALMKQSGTMIGDDYRGEKVLAAYEPIMHLNWGIVAKIDLAELRTPFIRATMLSSLAAALIILFGSWLIIRLTASFKTRLKESHAQQQELLELSPIGLALCDLDGKLIEVNAAFAEIIGFTVEEALTLSYWDITPAKYKQDENRQMQRLLKDGHYGPYEKEYIHKDGFFVPVRLSGKLIKRGGNAYIWSSVEDISDKVITEKRLRQSAAIFDSTDEGILITDENNRITMVNPAFSEITGYSEEEALGQNPSMLQSGNHEPTFYQKMWEHLDEDGSWRGEMWNRRKDGSVFPVWQHISIIRDASRRIQNYISVFSDISELKAVEQQLAHLAHHDELTGLPNRLYFKAHVAKSLQSAKRNRGMMALLFLDLDGFKQINDSYGHDVGDELLKIVANRLKSSLREEDTVARMGGDEFMIILNKIRSADDASLVAGNILEELSRPIQVSQHELLPTTSIGISIYPQDAESVLGLQKAADHAMYLAKGEGKNTFTFFAQHM